MINQQQRGKRTDWSRFADMMDMLAYGTKRKPAPGDMMSMMTRVPAARRRARRRA